jgi:NDP-sugar pyrophosphorylase family protein
MNRAPEVAVLLAAGRGERLRPHTDRTPKPLLLIDGRPTLDYVLRAATGAGIRRACLVTHHLSEQIERYVGDGSAWGLQAVCCRQPRLDGTASALQAAVRSFPEFFRSEAAFLLSATDYALPPHYLADLVRAYATGSDEITVSLKRVPADEMGRRSAVLLRPNGRIARIIEKPPPEVQAGPLGASLTFVLPGRILDYLPGMAPSDRGEFEIQGVINRMLADRFKAGGLLQETPPEWRPES